MRRMRSLSRMPGVAASIAPEVKLTFLIQVLQTAVPLFQNKNPQNPLPPASSGSGSSS
ncbi:MAG TPA: hypothetical protein PLH06_14700 [Candidatus Hydrogenedentes bacterium]|nr:hypothetical protein [Candidatus Hydrogenedentota bacterium]